MEILIGISHPHIPLRLVLTLLPDGLQHFDGTEQGFVPLVVWGAFVMVSDDGVVFQRSGQSIGGTVVPPIFRDGIQSLNTASVFILIVPLLQLLEEFFFVLRGVRDIVHTRQRLVQRLILILGFWLIILLL